MALITIDKNFPETAGYWKIAIYNDFLIKKIFQYYRLINFKRLPAILIFYNIYESTVILMGKVFLMG